MILTFKNYTGTLEGYFYHNYNLCLRLESPIHGTIAVATINVPDVKLFPGHVTIKDYSENEGMTQTLQMADVIGQSVKSYQSGHVNIHEHILSQKAKFYLYHNMMRRYNNIDPEQSAQILKDSGFQSLEALIKDVLDYE